MLLYKPDSHESEEAFNEFRRNTLPAAPHVSNDPLLLLEVKQWKRPSVVEFESEEEEV